MKAHYVFSSTVGLEKGVVKLGEEFIIADFIPDEWKVTSLFRSPGEGNIVLESTMPLDFTDLENSNGAFLYWCRTYGIPNYLWNPLKQKLPYSFSFNPPEEIFRTIEGKKVCRYIPIKNMQYHHRLLKATIPLWEGFVTENTDLLQEQFKFVDSDIAYPNPVSESLNDLFPFMSEPYIRTPRMELKAFPDIYLQYGDTYLQDDTYLQYDPIFNNSLLLATLALKKIINMAIGNAIVNLNIHPHKDWLEATNSIEDPLVYMWEVIRQDICGKGDKKWHFKRCRTCKRWIDTKGPGHRSTRTLCDSCEENDYKKRARVRAANSRKGHAPVNKKPHGRPRKEQ